jgi:hypothetical protein
MSRRHCPHCGKRIDDDYERFDYCPYCRKGLKSGCFIATAAYGTPMAPELDLLRAWRDAELSSIYLGREFIKLYYRLSPPVARFIEKRDLIRKIVRTLLIVPIGILKNRKKGD